MRRIFVLLVIMVFSLLSLEIEANYDDNIFGDYLLAVSKKKISMDLEGASLIDVLKVLSQQTGLSFVSSEAVGDRRLTVYLENVSLKDAIDTIFVTNNLAYEFYPESKIFIVKDMGAPTIELETKVYYLKHARVSSSRLFREIEEAMVRGAGVGEGEGGGGAPKAVEDAGIIEAVRKVLSENGRVTQDPRTNSLIVIDVPSQFTLIDKVIKALDIPEQKVLIEVEILDVTKQTTDKLGVQWPEKLIKLDALGARTTSFPFGGDLEGSTNYIFKDISTPSGEFKFVDLAARNFSPSILKVINAELVLSFLKTQKDTKILARPKILTLSGETAEIKLTADEVVGVTYRQDPDTQQIEYDLERRETGTVLRVTPHVNPRTREITMLVEPTVAVAHLTPFMFQDLVVKDVHYRKTKSVISIKENDTFMLGGLIRQEKINERTKVPFFGDIPLLGALFRSEDGSVEERELLVFLTPRIITDSPAILSKPVLLEGREQSLGTRRSAIKNALAKFE